MDNSHLAVCYALRTCQCYLFHSVSHTLRGVMPMYSVYNCNHHKWEKAESLLNGKNVCCSILGLYGSYLTYLYLTYIGSPGSSLWREKCWYLIYTQLYTTFWHQLRKRREKHSSPMSGDLSLIAIMLITYF